MVVPITLCLLLLLQVSGKVLVKTRQNSLEEPIDTPTEDYLCSINDYSEIVSKFLDVVLELLKYNSNSKQAGDALRLLKESLENSPPSNEKYAMRLKLETVKDNLLNGKLKNDVKDQTPIFFKARCPGMNQNLGGFIHIDTEETNNPYCHDCKPKREKEYKPYKTHYHSHSAPPNTEELPYNKKNKPFHFAKVSQHASESPKKIKLFLTDVLPHNKKSVKTWPLNNNPYYTENNFKREPQVDNNTIDYLKSIEKADDYLEPNVNELPKEINSLYSDSSKDINKPLSEIPLNSGDQNTLALTQKIITDGRGENYIDTEMNLPDSKSTIDYDNNDLTNDNNVLSQHTVNASENAPNLVLVENNGNLVVPLTSLKKDKQKNLDEVLELMKKIYSDKSGSQTTNKIDYSTLLSQLGFSQPQSKLTAQKHGLFGHKNKIKKQFAPDMKIASFGPSFEKNILHSHNVLPQREYQFTPNSENVPNNSSFPFQYENVIIDQNIFPHGLDSVTSHKYLKNNNLHSKYVRPVDNDIIWPHLPRSLSISNLLTLLQSNRNKEGIIELTYVLQRSKPIIYYPTYYVKYRVPYTTFVKGYRDLLRPHLDQFSQSYQDLLDKSNVTELSVGLREYNKDDLLKLVFDKGALVGAKIVNEKDDHLNKRVHIMHKLNVETDPSDILVLTNTTLKEPAFNDLSRLLNKKRILLKSLKKIPHDTEYSNVVVQKNPKKKPDDTEYSNVVVQKNLKKKPHDAENSKIVVQKNIKKARFFVVEDKNVPEHVQDTNKSSVITKPSWDTGPQNTLPYQYPIKSPDTQNNLLNPYLYRGPTIQNTYYFNRPALQNNRMNPYYFQRPVLQNTIMNTYSFKRPALQSTIINPYSFKRPALQNTIINPYSFKRPTLQNTIINPYYFKSPTPQNTLNPYYFKRPVTQNTLYPYIFEGPAMNPVMLPSVFARSQFMGHRLHVGSSHLHGR